MMILNYYLALVHLLDKDLVKAFSLNVYAKVAVKRQSSSSSNCI